MQGVCAYSNFDAVIGEDECGVGCCEFGGSLCPADSQLRFLIQTHPHASNTKINNNPGTISHKGIFVCATNQSETHH